MLKSIFIVFGAFIITVATLSVIGNTLFYKNTRETAKKILNRSKIKKLEIIKEQDIKELPQPVQRYLKYTQIIGKEKIKTARLKQGGYFRIKENQKWMPIKAEQYFNIDSVEFIWIAKVNIFPLISMFAKDEFINGKGNLSVKLFGLFRVVDAKGHEIDNGEIMRFLAECIWFPTSFLNKQTTWETIDNLTAKAIIEHKGVSASVIFHFNKKGEIKKVSAKRQREVNGRFVLDDWEGRIIEYRLFNGIRIPNKVEILWKLNTGEFCYDKIEIIDIEYNVSSTY